jgi:hypothetical protein
VVSVMRHGWMIHKGREGFTQPRRLSRALYRDNRAFLRGPIEIQGRICAVCRACMSRCSSFIREVPLYFWGALGPRWTDGRSIRSIGVDKIPP